MVDQKLVKHNKWLFKKQLLLAVSGGVDSMVMLHFFLHHQVYFEVFHLDHLTRSGQSTTDALALQSYCKANDIAFHYRQITPHAGNFQNEARKQRQVHLQTIRKERKLDYICTAHHQDDLIESFLLGAIRGSHFNRLVTPRYQEDMTIRPLLKLSKNKIREYAKKNKVPVWEDATNTENNYIRNKLRNQWLPSLLDSIPQGKSGLTFTIKSLKETDQFLNAIYSKLKKEYVEHRSDYSILHVKELLDSNLEHFIFQYLHSYGFHQDHINQMLQAQSGARFYSSSHLIIKDQNILLLRSIEYKSPLPLVVESPGTYLFNNEKIDISYATDSFQEQDSISFKLYADAFPLTFRVPKAGDRMKPSKLRGKSTALKKIFRSQKLNYIEIEKCIVISENSSIIGVYPIEKSYLNSGPENRKLYISITSKSQ